MDKKRSFHSICRWTFNPGKGGFVPARMRPAWDGQHLSTADVVRLIKERIAPRLPEWVTLGLEVHYDTEINEENAAAVSDALSEAGMYLAMITPGAHSHFGYGGIASLDPRERQQAEELGLRTVDLVYGPLRKNWHPDPELAPTFVLWNGSYGYDLGTIGVRRMYQNLKESVAALCRYEAEKGGALYIGIEPKPNEGHPAMLLPTVASALLFFRRLEEEFGIPRAKKGVNKEFGHSEMIGLDHVYDTVEELDNNAMVHMHLNSQGYNDGITLGGPGRYDIDHGVKITGFNIAIAGLLQEAGYNRWCGHDMLVRPYDNEEQGLDRIVRSILSWEACAQAAANLDQAALMDALANRATAKAEDIMRNAVVEAHNYFNQLYKG
ncbi:MAG TPA: xylose isomerase [Firmicutes bacterium]|uniref:Xylose isomerase n=1 Tax=Capillibacterium thermochitinicola TaxID=2699427 RepID=A0A8J6HZX9_9FIRM|nr:xylose isomerase [Capillibacterium thermochitinicola]MBA2133035.1 xylose isomerase [Capillibacterium thermochitinicola]HHW12992.1 xylose isomerase [Bacillota bacterium]